MKATDKQKQQFREYYLKNKDKLKTPKRRYYLSHKQVWTKFQHTPEYRTKAVNRNQQLRLIAINKYGGKCACCEENKLEFLAIDHIDGGGGKHRRTISGSIFQWLKKNNYPVNGYRVLCHNCNLSLAFYKHCPHNVNL